MARIALEPAKAERRLRGHGPRQRQRGLAGGDAGAPITHVDVDEDAERHAVGGGLATEIRDIRGVVDDEERVGRRRDEPHQPPDRRGRDDLGRDQEAADAGARHHLGFAELRAGDAERALVHLPASDLRAAVGLCVGPKMLAGSPRVRGHAAEVAFEAVEVEQQRWCRDVVARHRRGMLRCWMPL